MRKILTILLLALAAFLFVFLFSFSTSPFYLGYSADATLYEQMGLLITQKGTPYVDIYDNKGLLLYLINALGLLISPQFGIALLQGLFLTATLIAWKHLLAYFKLSGTRSIIVIFLSLLLLACFYQGGNLTEEYSLLPISLSILLLQKGENRHFFMAGLCMGCVVFLKMSNLFPLIGFTLFALWPAVSQHRILDAAKQCTLIVAGGSVIACLCTAYMLITSGWEGTWGMIYYMFLWNFEHLVGSVDRSAWVPSPIPHVVTIALFVVASAFFFKKEHNLMFAVIVALLSMVPSLVMRPYAHYHMVLIPVYVLILGRAADKNLILAATLCMISVFPHSRGIYSDFLRTRREILLDKVTFREAADNFHELTLRMDEKTKSAIFNFAYYPGLSLLNREGIVQSNPDPIFDLEKQFFEVIQDSTTTPECVLLPPDTELSDEVNKVIGRMYPYSVPIGEYSWNHITLRSKSTFIR
ncbi:MAG: hypothetical protein IJU19_01725 [Bacteroidales bacterium]|nr:hypothetical protein [Bacteroidales bacterium]